MSCHWNWNYKRLGKLGRDWCGGVVRLWRLSPGDPGGFEASAASVVTPQIGKSGGGVKRP